MNLEPVCVAPTGDQCGEGAVWHAAHCAVYWTDINRFLIHRFTPSDRSVRSWFFDQPVTAMVLTDRPEVLAVVLGSSVILWEPDTDRRRGFGFDLEGWPEVRLNDGRADPRGSLWVGSMANNVRPDGSCYEVEGQKGILFRIHPNGDSSIQRSGIGVSNTVAWSPDRRRFYFGDSLANIIWSYGYDAATGEIANEKPFFAGYSRGLPDGSAVDSEGFLWNCRFNGSCIVRVAPSGQVERVIEMPTENITTCTFGGKDLTTLYITTAAVGCSAGDRLAGSLFSLETGIRGLAENTFDVFGTR